ncbi:hypothetical protein RJ641_031473 [Dillenia turbinata]|uniref:Uncharacterized protein n=1 Tax=Dillenia turbinata TaxID=194707 RepID=A0AAN8ZKZ6_9MAGN
MAIPRVSMGVTLTPELQLILERSFSSSLHLFPPPPSSSPYLFCDSRVLCELIVQPLAYSLLSFSLLLVLSSSLAIEFWIYLLPTLFGWLLCIIYAVWVITK